MSTNCTDCIKNETGLDGLKICTNCQHWGKEHTQYPCSICDINHSAFQIFSGVGWKGCEMDNFGEMPIGLCPTCEKSLCDGSCNLWKACYINQLIKRGVNKEFAEETYSAGRDTHDFSCCPEDAADDELSYWGD